MSAWKPERDASGFYLSSGPGPTSIWIESDRIDECMAYCRKEGLCRIAVSPFKGFHGLDIDFLEGYPAIRGVSLSDVSKVDIGGLRFLEETLEYLLISDNRQPLDLARFRNLEEFRAEWHPKLRITSDCRRLRVLDLSKYKPKSKDLTELADLPALKDLSIIQSPLVTVEGVQRYRTLRRLELSYMPRLERLRAIVELGDALLEELECQRCPKIRDYCILGRLPSLRTLKLNRCNDIPDIKFIKDMKSLEDFRFMNTNVEDGDLSPLLLAKQLRGVAFTNKRHFSHRCEDIEAELQKAIGPIR